MRGPGSMEWSSSRLDDDLAAALDTRRIEAGVRFAVMDLGAETTALRGFFDPWAHEVLLADELVARLGELEVARHLAEAAASVAINLGLAVIGDGVTAERQLELLEGAGCYAAQGPLWGERMTADELVKWLATVPL